jgi:hypothetical protein
VFGSSGSPAGACVGQEQNIFDSVFSWAWTSMPMTVSYWVGAATIEPILSAAMVGWPMSTAGRARLARLSGSLVLHNCTAARPHAGG